jgi:single-strand DNA-binding protein
MYINNVVIGGNLVRNPDFKILKDDNCVAEFSVAVNRKFKVNGEPREEVDFVAVVAWNRLAEVCRDRLCKGMPVVVLGRIRQDRWEKDGKQQSKTKVHAESVQSLRPKEGGE